ncbi:MAG TPA: YdeI/OmpD-associated family protein [Candidatus Limnocylindria bacterium]|nr:YdeI/OmpD-associated family protein [Candidatus Limnocylindria bacterium]
MSASGYPRVHPKTTAEWRSWLRDHHASAQGVWLVSYRRATGKPFVEYEDAVQEALCYGWIDSVVKPVDDLRTMSLYTPRKAGSGWSRTNKERIARLVKEGRLRPAGLAKIEAAKRDGTWTLLDSVEALEVPPDLKRALAAAGATRRFDALTPGAKKPHLASLVTAKRPETRAKRLAAIVRSVSS